MNIDSFQNILLSIQVNTMQDGKYCALCKHQHKTVDRRGYENLCKAESVYCCPAVDRFVTVVEADIFGSKHTADRDWLKADL